MHELWHGSLWIVPVKSVLLCEETMEGGCPLRPAVCQWSRGKEVARGTIRYREVCLAADWSKGSIGTRHTPFTIVSRFGLETLDHHRERHRRFLEIDPRLGRKRMENPRAGKQKDIKRR